MEAMNDRAGLRAWGRMAIAGALVAVLAVMPALADTDAHSDADDTRGILDVAGFEHGHKRVSGKRKLVHRISTYEGWDRNDLTRNSSLQIEFQLPGRNRTNPPERLLVINVRNDNLRARMYSTLGDPPKFLANVGLSRPSRRTVEVTFPKRLLRRSLSRYRYRVSTYYLKRGTSCGVPEGCADDAPDARANGNRNWVLHELS